MVENAARLFLTFIFAWFYRLSFLSIAHRKEQEFVPFLLYGLSKSTKIFLPIQKHQTIPMVKNIKLVFTLQIGENQRKYYINSNFTFIIKLLMKPKTMIAQ